MDIPSPTDGITQQLCFSSENLQMKRIKKLILTETWPCANALLGKVTASVWRRQEHSLCSSFQAPLSWEMQDYFACKVNLADFSKGGDWITFKRMKQGDGSIIAAWRQINQSKKNQRQPIQLLALIFTCVPQTKNSSSVKIQCSLLDVYFHTLFVNSVTSPRVCRYV